MPDEELVVEVPQEGVPPSPQVEEKKPEAPPTPKIEPIEDLRAQLETLKGGAAAEKAAADAARQEAERQRLAREAAETARDKLAADLTESNVATIDNALAAAKAEADNYEREQQAAFEAGDFKAASLAGRKMAKAEATISRLEEGKANLAERRLEKPKPEGRRETAQPVTETRSQAWLKAHPAYNVPGSTENFEAIAAHNKAMAKRIVVDSNEYFDFVEQELGLRAKPVEKQPEQRTRAMPGAPVSRDDSPTGGQTSPTRVTLTKGEALAATDGTHVWNWNDPNGKFKKGEPIGLVEMARRKTALSKQGAYDKSYTEQ